jgi:hypothetical protein
MGEGPVQLVGGLLLTRHLLANWNRASGNAGSITSPGP